MELEEFQKIPPKKRIIARQTLVRKGESFDVLTAWDGHDWSDGDAPRPMIYSTFVGSSEGSRGFSFYPDHEHAMMGHQMMIAVLKAREGASDSKLKIAGYFLTNAFLHPRNITHAWWNLVIMSLCVLMQLSFLTLDTLRGSLSYGNIVTLAFGIAYGYAVRQTLRALKRLRRERDEEQRTEKEREEFQRIVAPLKELGTLDE